MTTRVVLIVGAIVGLLVSSAVLALTVGWRTTIPDIMITASSVVINCTLYMALAYAIRQVARFIHTLLL